MATRRAVKKKEHPLSMRLPEADIAIIDRAAGMRGRSRTDFVRDAAVRAAVADARNDPKPAVEQALEADPFGDGQIITAPGDDSIDHIIVALAGQPTGSAAAVEQILSHLRPQQPVPVSAEQIGIFSRLYPMNARPVQSAGGRIIKESN